MLQSNTFAEAAFLSQLQFKDTTKGVPLPAGVRTREQERHVGDVVVPEPSAHKADDYDDRKNEYGEASYIVKRQCTERQKALAFFSSLDGAKQQGCIHRITFEIE